MNVPWRPITADLWYGWNPRLWRKRASPLSRSCAAWGIPAVHVMPSEYRHDLSDVPQRSLIWLKNAGLCLDQLNDYLMEETLLYGDDA